MKGTVLLLAIVTASAVQARAAEPGSPRAVHLAAAAALSSVSLQQQLVHVDARRSKKREVPKFPLSSGPQSAAAKALLKQGKDAQRLGDGEGAMSYFERAVEVAMADGDAGSAARAHGAAGRLLLSVGQGNKAVERLGQAVAADPTYSAGHLNLAHAHLTNGNHRRGLRVVRRFLDGAPNNADAHRILGHLLAATGDSAAAEDAWRTAIKYKPDDSESYQALALSLFGATTATAEAVKVISTAATLLLNATAAALHASGFDSSSAVDGPFSRGLLAELEQRRNPALPLRRQYRRMFALACVSSRRVAYWASVDEHTRRLLELLREERADSGASAAGPPSLDPAFALVVPLPASETVFLARGAIEFFHKDAKSAAEVSTPTRRSRSRLRVCYVGSEFGDKPVGHLLTALVAATNSAPGSSGLISFVYQLAAEPPLPQLRRLLEQPSLGVARHLPLSASAAVAPDGSRVVETAIADDECDVVVDMLGWSTELQATISRREHRAPLTISMLSYPATRSAPYIDALVGDPIVAPPELRQSAYGERIIDMPFSYHVTDQASAFPEVALDDRFARTQLDFDWLGPTPDATAVEPHQQWRGRGPILCNFNSEWRVTPPTWRVWMNLLRRLGPGSQETSATGHAMLWQVGTVAAALDNLKSEMAAAGLSSDRRLVVTAKRSRTDHLAVAPVCDFHLDSTDHNAHSTGLDGLWAGVPLLTMPGERFAARVGASITTALGISWRHNPTVFSYKEYEDHGSVLGSNATHTGLLRADLVRARRESPLFDTDRWAKDYVHLLQQSVATMTEPQ